MVQKRACTAHCTAYYNATMQEFHRRKNGLLFVGDLLVLALALLLTLSVRYQSVPDREMLSLHLAPFSILFAAWVVVFLIVGLYDESIAFDRKRLPGIVLRTQTVNMFIGMTLFFAFPFTIAPKTNLVIYLIISTVLIVFWRLYIYPKLQPPRSIKALIVGQGEEVASTRNLLEVSPFFKQVDIDHIDTSVYTNTSALSGHLESYLKNHSVDMIVADTTDRVVGELAPLFFKVTFAARPIRFYSLAEFYERLFSRLPPSVIHESWMLEHMQVRNPHYAYDFFKRLIDIIGAVILLVPCLFIFPVVILLMRFLDPGPVFYRTERVGRYDKRIQILKFRTMTGADKGDSALKSTLHVTPFGAKLRRFRIDELPQLLNVLKGELSFIGPRPEMPALVDVYEREIPYYRLRHLIKPGLSGWAQINNFDVPRQGVDVTRTIDKLSFDLYYLRHRSLLLDMEIVLKTVDTVLSRTGS